jgi:hypothetical protein
MVNLKLANREVLESIIGENTHEVKRPEGEPRAPLWPPANGGAGPPPEPLSQLGCACPLPLGDAPFLSS